MNYYSQTKNHATPVHSFKFWLLTLVLVLIYSTFLFSQNIVYIDPGNSGDPNQNGSEDHPYDSWSDFSLESNTTYLQKSGSIYYAPETNNTIAISLNNKSNITISSYGEGDKPIIIKTIGNNPTIKLTRTDNITLDGLEIMGNWDNSILDIGGYWSSGNPYTTNTLIINCDIHQGWSGLRSMPAATGTTDLTIKNCNIWDIGDDGIFSKGITNFTIEDSHIWNVNLRWWQGFGDQAGGDAIQLVNDHPNWLVKNCILDRRATPNKFAFIHNSEIGWLPTTYGRFIGNTVYPPLDTIGDNSGSGLFLNAGRSVEIAYNKFVGRDYYPGFSGGAFGQLWYDTIKIYYNVIDSIKAGSEIKYTCDYLEFNNNTLISNVTGSSMIYIEVSNGFVRNNILASNTTSDPLHYPSSSNLVRTNNIIQKGNVANWNASIGVVDWGNGNFMLNENSPARNTGYEYDNYFYDIDSISVPQENIRDMGACEYTDGSQTNNNPPVITNQSFSIAENSSNGTSVGTVLASDPDAGQTLSYSIIGGNTNNAFAINPGTGGLTVNNTNALNFENITTFGLTVRVQDNGQGNLYSQATITVNLTNVNENPVINNQAFTIAENSANGTSVGTVVASDPDAGQTLTYSITAGNTSNAFTINSNTGVISVNSSFVINYEIITFFTLSINVQDNGVGNLSSQASITVNISDVNESPVITDQMFTIPENSPNGYQAGLVIASDPDNGQMLIYTILDGNTDNAFMINSLSGELVVANSAAINSTINPVFNLLVEVMDDGTGNLSSAATITVNVTDLNQPPQIGNQSFSVAENSSNGQPVGTVIATDPDAGQTLTYSIISGNSGNAFQINTSTGAITVNNGSVLNYEVIPSFGLIVRVQDNGPGNLYSQATVIITITNVNENPVINNQAFYIAENSSNGTQVGNVIASDPDAGQSLTFSITGGNTSNAFAINASTGTITVNNSAALNFEAIATFGLTVRAQDNGQGNLYSQATISINLTDVNEAPVMNNQIFSIAENSGNGSSVGDVVASDPDAGQTLSYSIISGNTNNAFAINSSTGAITVNNSAALNYELITTFGLIVKVEDNGIGILNAQATMTINLTDVNESPVINNQLFTLAENSLNGYSVGTVIASDPDAGQSLTYLILSGNTGNAFQINETNGQITVNNSNALNFESITTFGLTIKVQDNGQGNLFAQATVNINLTDVNEVPVIENQSLNVNLNAGAIFHDIHVSIIPSGLIEAYDPDAGQNITFTIEAGNGRGIFSLDEETGELSIVDPYRLNLIEYFSYPLLIKVVDDSPQALFSHAVFTLNLHIIGIEYFLEGQEGAGTAGIADPNMNVIAYNIYPNPATCFINVEIENMEPGNLTLSVLTLNGELKYSEEHLSVGDTFKNSFNIETLSKGMYIMQIRNGNSMRLEKFIKL